MRATFILIVVATLPLWTSGCKRVHSETTRCGDITVTYKAVNLKVPKAFIDVIRRWDDRAWLFTSDRHPITSIEGLRWNQVALSGMDHFADGRAESLARALGVEWKGKAAVMLTTQPIFVRDANDPEKDPPRLLLAWCTELSNTGMSSAARILFESE